MDETNKAATFLIWVRAPIEAQNPGVHSWRAWFRSLLQERQTKAGNTPTETEPPPRDTYPRLKRPRAGLPDPVQLAGDRTE